jgi:hypothetical protein
MHRGGRVLGIFMLCIFATPSERVFPLDMNEDDLSQSSNHSISADDTGLDSTTTAVQLLVSDSRASSLALPPSLTTRGKLGSYAKTTYGPTPAILSMAGAGLGQAFDYVPEWGQGTEGYGKRMASSFGRRAIKNSIQFSLMIALHEKPLYVHSNRSEVWERALMLPAKHLYLIRIPEEFVPDIRGLLEPSGEPVFPGNGIPKPIGQGRNMLPPVRYRSA